MDTVKPEETFAFAAETMRTSDAICIGVYTKSNPKMVARRRATLRKCLEPTRGCLGFHLIPLRGTAQIDHNLFNNYWRMWLYVERELRGIF